MSAETAFDIKRGGWVAVPRQRSYPTKSAHHPKSTLPPTLDFPGG